MKKPRLESKVYLVKDDEIKKMYVYAKGKNAFVVSDSKEYYWNDNEWYEQYYDDYMTTWFSSLKDAKDYLKRYFKNWEGKDKVKFEKIDEDLWEATA